MSDDEIKNPEGEGDEEERRGRFGFRAAARRLLDEPGPVRETKEVLGAILDTSSTARAEAIRMIGKEVRLWLDSLGLAEGVHYLLTNYSLEVSASINLKPLSEKIPPPPHARGEGAQGRGADAGEG